MTRAREDRLFDRFRRTGDVRALAEVVTSAMAIPSEQWPATQRNYAAETPEEAVLIALTTAAIRSYCKEEAIAYSLAATKKSTKALVRAVTRDEHGEDEQATSHVEGFACCANALPHSLHTSDSPRGYAHAGQRPRFTRTNRRSANGPGISSQRTAA